jgi:hypothetical protein
MSELRCSNKLKLTNYESEQFEAIKALLSGQFENVIIEEDSFIFKTEWVAPSRFTQSLSRKYPLITFSLSGDTESFVTVITLINGDYVHLEEIRHDQPITENQHG